MAQFSSKLSCTPELWNPRESRLNGKSKEAVEINAKIDKLLLAINSAFDSLLERKQDFDATAVKEAFQGSVETQMTLLKRLDIHIEDMQSRIGIDVAKSSMSTYVYTRRYLGEYIKKRFKVDELAFGQLTEQFIHDYENFILDEKGHAVDTARHYLAIIKKVCRKAYKEGHSERFFFQHYVLPKQTVKTPRALSRESFEKIRDVEIAPHRTTHRLARDLFLFACYTGVAYIDAVTVTKENLYTDEEGKLWLKYRRKKNELRAAVKLLPEALALIEKYHDDERDTLFLMIHYPNLRGYMKALAVLAGVKEDVSYHVGRHSFASLITLEAGVPNLAVDNEMLRSNPCEDMEYEKKPSPKHKYVTREEIKRIMEIPLGDGRAELGRRAFIFSCLTGLAYADIKQLHPRHVETTAEGRRFIRINRKKTGVEAVIPLHPIADQILDLYNTTDMHNPVFPLPSRDSIWHEINEIGVILGRTDDLSYHQARHGFGVLLISESISIESIAKMMGHSNITTTQGYARITEDKISKEMDKLIEKRSRTNNNLAV